MERRVVVEIDLKALVRNYRKIAAHVKPAKVLCVLKANAYGLGERLCVGADAQSVGICLENAKDLRRTAVRCDPAVVPDERLQIDFNDNSSFHTPLRLRASVFKP